ncbi:uncharacterized protein LOC141584654 [Saimiri boliviensis]|uniref:uncharacterized protein LOC141584654 n=1 Tax=Saimiri boliviensis TaxID=27679 RepID=UPI003D77B4D4
MSNARIAQYQALLLDQPCIKFSKTTVLNSTTLLPDSESEEPIRDCQQTIDALHAARPDLTDVPLQNPEEPGDEVLVKRFTASGLTPRWKGPYTMILVTPTTVKVDGLTAWIHHSYVKTAPARCKMGSGSILNGLPKAKTFAPFTVIILISLLPVTTPWKGPPLTPAYYQWVITEGFTGEYVSSLTGKGSTLVNLTLEYIPENPITFSLDFCPPGPQPKFQNKWKYSRVRQFRGRATTPDYGTTSMPRVHTR